jgi:hypothetical protein
MGSGAIGCVPLDQQRRRFESNSPTDVHDAELDPSFISRWVLGVRVDYLDANHMGPICALGIYRSRDGGRF